MGRPPKKLTTREKLIKKISSEKVISQMVIEQVVKHQFDSAHEALKTNNSVELSGFGKFLFNTKKAQRRIGQLEKVKVTYTEMLKNPEMPEKQAAFLKSKLSNLNIALSSLKLKLAKHETKGDI